MPRKKKIPTKGSPEVVREGNAQVKIYASTNRGRPMFSLVFNGLDGHRKTRNFADYSEAKLEAENVAIAIHNGTLDRLELTGEERRAHERARAIAVELGQPIDGVLVEFKKALDLLPEEVTLVEAAQFYVRHGAAMLEKRELSTVVEEFVEQLESDGRSERYVEDARARLHKLAAVLGGSIDEIDQRDLQRS